jgi:ATP-dependent Zn protease
LGACRPAPPDDLVKVANIGRSMVTRYGMVESHGHLAHE